MNYKKFILLGLVLSLFATSSSFAQVKEEKEEKFLKMERLRMKPPAFKWSASAAAFAGYDSNVNLSPNSKGDIFEQVLFSANIEKPWIKNSRFTFNYDFGYLNYNEVTDATNMLNHFRLAAHEKFSIMTLGTGYDVDLLVYPLNDSVTDNGNFAFHKFFLYAKHDITPRIYQQFLVEYGIKDYFNRKAMGDTLSSLQDKERVDRRRMAEYSIGAPIMPKAFFRLRARYTMNDSNARYVNYYDYESYSAIPSLDIRLSRKLKAYTSFNYTKKNYKSRPVTNENYKEKDKLYTAYMELRYLFSKNNAAVLSYTYRGDNSNDSLEKYTENVCSLGWQYTF